MERYWEVTARGVRPIMCNPEVLEKHSFRLYAGKKIFKDYSAAMLYWSGLRKKNKPLRYNPPQSSHAFSRQAHTLMVLPTTLIYLG